MNKINKEYKTNKNMKRELIRLTEGDLHKIIKESVKKILTEEQNDAYKNKERSEKFWKKPYVPDTGLGKKYSDSMRQSLSSSEITPEDEYEELYDNLLYDWTEMCDKLSQYKDPGEVLSKLIQKNPIFKKWYENITKKRENDASWRGYDDRTYYTKRFYDEEKDGLDFASPFAQDKDKYNDHRYDAW